MFDTKHVNPVLKVTCNQYELTKDSVKSSRLSAIPLRTPNTEKYNYKCKTSAKTQTGKKLKDLKGSLSKTTKQKIV